MQVVSIISTKGGVGKTTITANLAALMADTGLRVLMVDLDIQPTLSSYFPLTQQAAGGIYELLAYNEQDRQKLISHTNRPGLDIIVSNDEQGQLNTLLLHAADGRVRLRHLLPFLTSKYDLLLIDTQGARTALLEMAILASDQIVSPVQPEILAARELQRGTLQLLQDLAPYQRLGITLPPLAVLLNRVPSVSANSRLIQQSLYELFSHQPGIHILKTLIPAIEAYPKAATQKRPAHCVEHRRPTGRVAPSALTSLRHLALELFPHWQQQLTSFDIKSNRREYAQPR